MSERTRTLDLIRRLLNSGDVRYDELDQEQARLLDDVYPAGAEMPPGVAEDSRFRRAMDILRAMELEAADDPAHPWNRGALLKRAGRITEAGEAFLRAALLLEGTDLTDEDTKDWGQAAWYHAAMCFLRTGQLVTAARLQQNLTDDAYKKEVAEEVERAIRK